MSARRDFNEVKFFCGLIYRKDQAAEKAIAMLEEAIAPVDGSTAAIPFTMTDYYRDEMGEPLSRRFVSFSGLLDPQKLPGIKVAAMGMEEKLAEVEKRTVNLDPGYLSEANVIIATAKNHYHRVPLASGVYAHMEYVWKDGRLQFLPWTYPDFKTAAYLEFFGHLRERFRQEQKRPRE